MYSRAELIGVSLENGSTLSSVFHACGEAAQQIHRECEEILGTSSQSHDVGLAGCGSALVSLLGRQALQISHRYQSRKSADPPDTPTAAGKQSFVLRRLEDIISITYSKFYAFLFKDLPYCWRQLYTDASILKFCLLVEQTSRVREDVEVETKGPDRDELTEVIKVLDLALILAGGAGQQRGRKWIDQAFELLHRAWAAKQGTGDDASFNMERPKKRLRSGEGELGVVSPDRGTATRVFSTREPFTPPVKHPIKRLEAVSLYAFQSHLDNPLDRKVGPQPLVLTNVVEGWPACSTHPWNRPAYLLSQTLDGRRLVPVEIGRSYVDEGWGQKLITFGEFLRDYIDPSLSEPEITETEDGLAPPPDKPIAYLAQHQLFTQFPALRNDILIPDYCYTSPPPHPTDRSIDQPELDEPLLNAWFGPPGTITPLHNDPYHNLLVQVVGRKYVRLYSPLETERMHARGKEEGVEMGNTSMIDVGVIEGWDHVPQDQDQDASDQEKNERVQQAFKEVPFVDCILEPGDTLYIPNGWWHYVRGLSVSFSVSFWWN
ncbi:uncharacterized protein BCR38DRAFT_457487 [Pseudomassariella vexata]|uniref:JmjC domain-containing protein n=1 Tax=Pseudomassariella vexata TaxID=1141098 RepID=A0A1Y2E160_9PEZI|nr:uncharacterized protein BCR38DRAFT_457487 [Pseudomassariella vexata]ORY65293.1 hypothetical protein BCR38DRAFT_457487 [Pseudomassariella vexata]